MVVKLDQILDEGLTVQEPVSVELLTAAMSEGKGTGFQPLSPSELSATLRKVSGGVLLEGKLVARVGAPCKRCLTDVQLAVPVNFVLNLIPESRVVEKGDADGEDDEVAVDAGSFALEDANQEVFDGKKIDLDPILREQVLLALPMHAVCREDCKGLCGMCGQNLNEAVCGCEQKRVDPRLAALKNIKLN
jgi:uncharacterized protein